MHSYAILICAPFPPFVTDPSDTQYAYLCTPGYRRDKEQSEQPLRGWRQAGAKISQHVQMELSNELKPPSITPRHRQKCFVRYKHYGPQNQPPKCTLSISARPASAENSPRQFVSRWSHQPENENTYRKQHSKLSRGYFPPELNQARSDRQYCA
jgi:hypothetical protein